MKFLHFLITILLLVVTSCDEKPPFIEEEENLPVKCCTCLEDQGISDKYIYPYKKEELKQFDDYMEKLEVCQIPEDSLKNMCTIGLVDTYYDFPLLFHELFSTSSVKMGLKLLEATFNGFRELVSRIDMPEKLISNYNDAYPSNLESISDPIEIGVLQFQINFKEITMGYDSICEKFTSEQRRSVIEFGLKILDGKRKYKHNEFSIRCTLFLIGNMLLKEKYQPLIDSIENNNIEPLLNGLLIHATTTFVIEDYAKSYLVQTSNN